MPTPNSRFHNRNSMIQSARWFSNRLDCWHSKTGALCCDTSSLLPLCRRKWEGVIKKLQPRMPQRICARLAVASFCVFYLPINQLPYQTSDRGSGPIELRFSFQISKDIISANSEEIYSRTWRRTGPRPQRDEHDLWHHCRESFWKTSQISVNSKGIVGQ